MSSSPLIKKMHDSIFDNVWKLFFLLVPHHKHVDNLSSHCNLNVNHISLGTVLAWDCAFSQNVVLQIRYEKHTVKLFFFRKLEKIKV